MGSLRVERLVKHFGRWKVVDEVSLDVKQGEVVGLLGPNGAGKTTSFYMIVGLLRPNAGEIYLNGTNVTQTPMHERARMGVGYLAQEASIFRKLTVKQNIEAILETLGLSKRERKQRLEEHLEELSISHLADRKGHDLSGGERRRVEITRAMVTSPSYMLLDEPFVGIDPIAVADIQEIVRSLRHKGLGVLITDHSVRETLSTTDRAYIMYEGRILMSGTAEELAEDPQARRIYLGEKFRL
jgi:lipopolysaccharide export system ATP-binding protein